MLLVEFYLNFAWLYVVISQIIRNVQMGKVCCVACGDDIGTGLAVSMGDLTFHEACFVCNACGQIIGANNNFVNQDGIPYHKQCHQVGACWSDLSFFFP